MGGGLLAPDPVCFINSGDFECVHAQYIPRRPDAMTNNGLEFEARLIPVDIDDTDDSKDLQNIHDFSTSKQVYLCPLNCIRQGQESHLLSLFLSSREGGSAEHLSRVCYGRLNSLNVQNIVAENVRRNNKPWSRTIFVQQPHLSLRSTRRDRVSMFWFNNSLSSFGFAPGPIYLEDVIGERSWAVSSDHEGVLTIASRSTALIKFLNFSRPGMWFILRISCRASSATLGLQVNRNPGQTEEIEDLFGGKTIPSEKWLQACSFVDHTVAFEVGKSNRISRSLHPFAKGSVVAVFQKKLANRQHYDVKLSVEV